MTSRLLEPELATRPPRFGVVTGLALGVVAAIALSWLVAVGTDWFGMATTEQADRGAVALSGLILVVVGALLGLIWLGGRLHPLVPGVPAAWFLIVFAPSLMGLGAPPDWYPDPLASFFGATASPAAYVVLGYLMVTTVVWVSRRRHDWIFR